MKSKHLIIIAVVWSLCTSTIFAQNEQSPLLDSWKEYLQMKNESTFNLEWISIGPVINSARVEAIQGVPGRPGTLYVAFGSGNLWKTTNNGLSWKPIFENQSALGIGDIAVAPSDPDTIWLGSGESLKKARNFTMPGTGVFLSRDGGETWRNVGLHDSYHIGEIAVHPQNPEIAYVAVQGHFWTSNKNRGLYRTRDGGRTWDHVLAISERVGANDVVIAPSDPNVVYVSMWENNPGTVGPGSGVYRSSDGGETWKRMAGGFPSGPRTGRIGLAVSWTDADKAYALVDNHNRGENEAPGEVYRTLDGGKNWQRTHEDDLRIFSRIGWYFTDCYVNPKNDDEIYGLGVRMAHSSDGGASFDLVSGDVYHLFPNPADPLHLDHCELWINPENPANLALGNDGGLYISYDRGESWLHLNNLPTGEFYDIAVDNQVPYNVYGGTQDDASVFGPAREWLGKYPDGWQYVWLDAWSGGDGCYTVPDPVDPNTVYFSSQNGAIRRKDMKADRSRGIRPRFPRGDKRELRYNFITPYIISPHNHLTLYHAGNYVFKSVNRGDSWKLISPDLTVSSLKDKNGHSMGAIAESGIEPGLLFAGTDRGAFWVSRNDGVNWQEYSAGLPNHYIRSICPSRFVPGRVYLTVTGINDDYLGKYVFMSDNYGKNWQSIASNLPDEVSYCIQEDPTNENILYAGLYRGVYISTDRGRQWHLLGPDLPACAVSDLVIQEREMDLLAATHGRGIYKLNLRPIQSAFKNGEPVNPRLLDIPEARLPWINDSHRDPRYSSMEKVPITFFLTEESNVTITVKSRAGRTVWSHKLAAKPGFNQYRWDLVTEKVDRAEAYFFRRFNFIRAGEYQLEISGEGVDLKGKLTARNRQSPND